MRVPSALRVPPESRVGVSTALRVLPESRVGVSTALGVPTRAGKGCQRRRNRQRGARSGFQRRRNRHRGPGTTFYGVETAAAAREVCSAAVSTRSGALAGVTTGLAPRSWGRSAQNLSKSGSKSLFFAVFYEICFAVSEIIRTFAASESATLPVDQRTRAELFLGAFLGPFLHLLERFLLKYLAVSDNSRTFAPSDPARASR